MQTMTPRERIAAAINHRVPDRQPLDVGGCDASSMVATAQDRLKAYLGIEAETVLLSRRSGVVRPDDAILNRLGVATRMVNLGSPDHAPDRWEPDGDSMVDQWQVVWKSAGGHYIPAVGPLADASMSDLMRHGWPDPDDPGRFHGVAERARRLHTETDYAVILNLPVGIVHVSEYVRGFDRFLMDLVADASFAECLMDSILDYYLAVISTAIETVGEHVDVVMFGDDVAFQDRPMLRQGAYRRLIKPRHRRIIDTIKSKTTAPVLYHCCGAVSALIPDLIDIGVSALHPVQVSAKGMGDTAALKREFGADICFWGAIDTQHVLPFGSPEDVRTEVNRRIRDLGTDGGYVVGAVHNIQGDVPPENILAMADAVADFRW